MAQTIDYDRANFLHRESDPTYSRALVSLNAAVQAGDLLILGNGGYASYTGTAPEVKSKPGDDEIVIAVALEPGRSGDKIACIVRSATLIQDKINYVRKDDLEEGKPLAALKPYFAKQQLVLRLSVAVERSIKS